MKWADVIVPIGGDGTFLLAAGRASPLFAQSQHKTPIVGFNSDPERSEGRLMLPRHYSENPEEAVAKIKCVSRVAPHGKLLYLLYILIEDLFYFQGNFEWMHRSRIRTTLLGNNGKIPESTDLFRHTVYKMEQEKTEPEYLLKDMAKKYKAKMKRVLPYLALNEVSNEVEVFIF